MTEEEQLAAVNQHGYVIQYIQNPSIEVQLVAFNKNGYVIGYINNPAIEVQLVAVNQDVNVIEYTNNLDESVIEMYFESDELNKWSIENIYKQTKQVHIKVYLKMKYPYILCN